MPFWKKHRPHRESRPAEHRPTLTFGLASDVGRVRRTNQDHLLALLTSQPGMGGQIVMGLFIVADGMGGHAGGATASRRAVEIVAARVLQDLLLPVLRGDMPEAIQDILRGAVQEANARILAEAAELGNDMGTTLTAALVLGDHCHAVHVGDSRLYSYGKAGLQRRTRDHSMVARLQELGQISEEEARHHPKRNYLYQSLGQQAEVEADLVSFPLADCTHLLLCCDGLWGSVEEKTLAQALASGASPQELCDRFVALANAAGGEDNISVITVALPTAGPPAAVDTGEG